MAPVSVKDALGRALQGLAPLDVERVPVPQAGGRVLAVDLVATLTQPPFDASAMDGYAVRATDVATLPRTLSLVGRSVAGARYDGLLMPGEAVRIFTGAPVPEGADTIVIQEDTEERGESVLIKGTQPEPYIRPRGQDFKEGDKLLTAGTRLGARVLMLAAAMNYADLPVRKRPQVAVLSTGDELREPGSHLDPDQIVASVSFGIAALVEASGGEPINLGIAADDERALADAIAQGANADILVTIGGASVGERDLVHGALTQAGLQLDFAKVAMRPGKPTFAGRLGSTRVLGLPGNPVSGLVCAIVFLRPMLRALLGEAGEDVTQVARLGKPLGKCNWRQTYHRATSVVAEDGTRTVWPLPSQDSSLMSALARADCLIVQPPNSPAVPEGEIVNVLPLPV